MFHTNSISVTSIILQMKSISPPALPILITAGFPIWSINGVEHPEPDLKLENSGHTTTSNPTVITFMQTQGPSQTQYGLKKWDLCALFLMLELILKIVWCNLPRCLRKLKSPVCASYKCLVVSRAIHKLWVAYLHFWQKSLSGTMQQQLLSYVFHKFKLLYRDHGSWQSSLIFLLNKKILQIEDETDFTHADG